MRIPAGTTDQYIYFVAVDATNYVTRETGLTSTNFTVAYANNSTATTVISTANTNVTQVSSTNAPGVYALLLNEGTTLAAGNDSQEMMLHITSSTVMAPVTRVVEIYRPKIALGETITASVSGQVDANITYVNDVAVTGAGTTASPWGP